jgi:hypothetical protein
MKPFLTDFGLTVNIPANPDNPLQLWDAPLPASPYTLPLLEQRDSDMRDGFRMGSAPPVTSSRIPLPVIRANGNSQTVP